jgi:exodeoxyribonuclease-3
MKKLITWNVNGLRSALSKGFMDFFKSEDADFFSVQEIKMLQGQAELELEGYDEYWNSAEKKGYSGTAVFTKFHPLNVSYNLDAESREKEGRVIALEYEDFYLINEYTPNSQDGLARLSYRMDWEDSKREYFKKLDAIKPLILCGDFNVAHNEIDLKNPKTNRKNAGFSDEERGKFTELLGAGFTDAFRFLYPELTGAYTWWSYRANARANNVGWRIDYFVVSDRIRDRIEDVKLISDVYGSDHCPVIMLIDI